MSSPRPLPSGNPVPHTGIQPLPLAVTGALAAVLYAVVRRVFR